LSCQAYQPFASDQHCGGGAGRADQQLDCIGSRPVVEIEVHLSERPASADGRAVPGHWEGDLIGGSKNSYIATLVERHSRYVMLIKVANKDTESVVSALIKQSQKLPGELYKSLTWDRGKEWLTINDWQKPLTLRFTSAIPDHPGSAVQMRTPIDCCANTYRAPLTCPYVAKPSSMLSPGSSTNVQERPCFIRLLRKNLQNVLRRSIEPTAISRHSAHAGD